MANQPKKYKKFVATAATATLVASAFAPVAGAAGTTFTDVPAGSDHAENIYKLVEDGTLSGFPDGTFKPLQEVNRATAVKFIGKLLVKNGFTVPADAKTKQRFNDLPVDFADQELVELAALVFDAGIITGSNGNLNSTQVFTRQQMAKVLVETYNELTGGDLVAEFKTAGFVSNIVDLADVDPGFKDYVAALQFAGLTTASATQAYNPTSPVNRGQLSSFVVRNNEYVEAKENVAPEVVSVSAINLSQILVTFNKEVDEESAETASNYTFDDVAVDANDTVELQADGKSVLITKEEADVFAQQQEVTVEVSGVEDLDGVAIEDFSTDIVALDNKVPTVVGASVTGPNTLAVEFSEPIDTTTVASTDFVLDNGSSSVTNPVRSASNPNVIELSISSALADGEHTLEVKDLSDYAGFKVQDTEVSFVKTTDEVAPVATVKSASETKVVLEFDEDVYNADADVNTNVDYYHTYKGQASYRADSVTVDGNEVTLNFTTTPLPEGDTKIYVDYVDADGTKIEDAWGNEAEEFNVTATVTADVTAPTVSSVEVEDSTTIDVTFSEEVSGATTLANYTLTDSNGDEIAISGVVNTTDNTYRLTTDTLTGGDYTLVVDGIKDTSLNENELAKYTEVLNVGDEVRPTVIATGLTDAADATATKIKVLFSEKMATTGTGSILNPDNYLLNAAELDEDAEIEAVDNGTAVVITLPTAQDLDPSTVTVGRVADVAGNLTAALSTAVTIAADVVDAADIINAKTTATNTVTFEVLHPLSAIDVTKFTVNGAAVVSATYTNTTVNDGDTEGALVTLKVDSANAWLTNATPAIATTAAGAFTTTFGTDAANAINEVTADETAAEIDTIETNDSDSNGQIDQIIVTYTEDLQDATVALDAFTVEGYEIVDVAELAAGVVTISVEELTTLDTDATPEVKQVKDVRDASPARNITSAQTTGEDATDLAAPLMISARATSATTLEITYSENVSTTIAGATDWVYDADGAGPGAAAVTASVAATDGSDNVIVLTLPGGTFTTGTAVPAATITYTQVANDIDDGTTATAGNAAVSPQTITGVTSGF